MAKHLEVTQRRSILRAAGLAAAVTGSLTLPTFVRAQLLAPTLAQAQSAEPVPGGSAASGIGAISPQEQQIELDRAIDKILKGARIREGRVVVDAPVLADNGNSVSCTVQVESVMSEADYVREIHVFLARNPRPLALSAWLGPWSSRAQVSTRVRLAASGRILAVAVMNDGSCWSGHKDVVVTVAACLDGS